MLFLTAVTPIIFGLRFEARSFNALKQSAFEISRLSVDNFSSGSSVNSSTPPLSAEICARYVKIIRSNFESFSSKPFSVYVNPANEITENSHGGFAQELRVAFKRQSLATGTSVSLTFIVPHSPVAVTCIPDGTGVIFP